MNILEYLSHSLQANMLLPDLDEQCNDDNAVGFPNRLIDAAKQRGIPVDQVELHGEGFEIDRVLRTTLVFSSPVNLTSYSSNSCP